MNSSPTFAEPAIAVPRQSSGRPRTPAIGTRLERVLLAIAAVLFVLHFVHLKADFPNQSPWMDWSKYTDEGWYGDAAIRHYELGHWNVPGDFNAAAALPVWPTAELVLFRLTGVSLVAARALTVTIFGLILVCCYFLLQRWAGGKGRRSLAPAACVLLLAASPFLFVFSRLAILEPPLILLTLAAMLVCGSPALALGRSTRRGVGLAVTLGVLLVLMVLTKTTGLFLFPGIFWLLWCASEYRLRTFARTAALICGVGLAAWGAYFLLFVRPHYLADYRYLFSANAYTGITRATFWQVIHDALADVGWIGETLAWTAGVAVLGLMVYVAMARRRSNPLVVALLLWVFGYAAFLTYHANLQPRYYQVLAVPLTMLTAIGFDRVLATAEREDQPNRVRNWSRVAAFAASAVLLFVVGSGVRYTLSYLLHPEYGWWSAAQQVKQTVDRAAATTGHSRLVLSISGSDLTLMTGLPSICDDFGTATLPDRVAEYRPGWFATWNDVEDDKMESLAPLYRLQRVLAIPVFDDPERNLLILYRLDPVGAPGPRGRSRRRYMSVPHRLRTKVGEQPSAVQLLH